MSWYYKEVTCERDLAGLNFANGEILYKYNINPSHQVNLAKSFIRMRMKLSKANGAQLDVSDNIAPNYLMAHSLFKQMYHCMDGKTVGEIQSYVSQIGALQHRINYPQSYKEKFLATTNFAKIDVEERLNDVILNGYKNPNIVKRQSIHLLNQADGAHILGTEELKVDENVLGTGTGNLIQYRNAGDAAAGAIDLRETELEVGDEIVFANLQGCPKRKIKTINQSTIEIDEREIPIFGAVDIEGDNFFYEKKGGKFSKTTQEFELVYKPPMGIWNYNKWLPAHRLELKMYALPNGTWQKNAIQSIGLNKTHETDFLLEVQDMIMYLCLKQSKHEDGERHCTYDDMRCQLTNITTTSNVDHHFIVDRESYAFTMALQDENVENNTLYPSTLFKIRNNEEQKLQRYWIQYNGKVLPNPYPIISKSSSKDFFTQRYYESIMYSDVHYTKDVESLDDWEEAGPFYTHKFGKSEVKTEKVTVSTLFENDAFENNHKPNLLLFDHFHRQFKMKVHHGKIVEMEADSVN